jgi:hypothetical protein
MRDCLISLGIWQPCRINNEDFDVLMLEGNDFETQNFPVDCHVFHPIYKLIRNATMQQELIALCIAKAQLCIYIGHV